MIATSIRGPRGFLIGPVVALVLAPACVQAAPFNLAPDGEPILGVGVDTFGTDDVFFAHQGTVNVINDQDVATPGPFNIRTVRSVDTFGLFADATGEFDFVGIIFDEPQSDVNAVRVQNFAANDGGWWGPPDDVVLGGAPLAASDLLPPEVQVSFDQGQSWTTIPSTNDYVESYTGVIRGTGVPTSSAGPLATFDFAAQSGITGIRLIGEGGGVADGNGFIGVIEMEVLQDTGVVFPTLDIDTATGAMTLHTGSGTARGIQGYSVTSSPDVGALNPSDWISVAGNYDQGNPGPNQIDPDHPWTRLSAPDSRTMLSEAELSGGTGGSLSSNLNLPLGDAWIRNPFGNDIDMEILLPDGRVRRVEVTYDGMSDNPFEFGDLNFDGVIDHGDWAIVRDNFNSSFAGLSPAESYSLGDLTGNGVNDIRDIALFKTLFDSANGAGAFEAMISAVVPEPSSFALLAIAAGLMGVRIRRSVAIGYQRLGTTNSAFCRSSFVAFGP